MKTACRLTPEGGPLPAAFLTVTLKVFFFSNLNILDDFCLQKVTDPSCHPLSQFNHVLALVLVGRPGR